jgi:hypothetical protein
MGRVVKRVKAARSCSFSVVVTALVITGCGGTAKSSSSSKQLTLAHVCSSHPKDVGTIAGGLFAFKTYMDSEDPSQSSALSAVSSDTTSAISDLQSTAVGATSSNLPAMRAFLQDLQFLSAALSTPAKYPTALIGDRDVAKIQSDAKQAGCPLGGTASNTSASGTGTSTTTSNPQAKAACTSIISDIPGLGTGPNGIGRYAKDVAKLLPVVPGAQQTVVIGAIGHLETLLRDIATGTNMTSAEPAVTSDARKIGEICAGYVKNP